MKITKYPGCIKCLWCNTILVSNYRHDYQVCSCNNASFVDGGYDYIRCGAKDVSKIELLTFKPVKKKGNRAK